MKLAWLVLFSPLLLVAACSSSSTGGGGAAGQAADTQAVAQVLKGAEWAHCWVVPDTSTTNAFFQRPQVKCNAPALDPSYPLPTNGLFADVLDAKGLSSSKQLTPGGGDVLVASTSSDGFPLQITIIASLKDTPLLESLSFTPSILVLESRQTISTVSAAPATSPVVAKQPFDLWPITVIDQSPGFGATGTPFSMSFAPVVVGQDTNASSNVLVQVTIQSQGTPTFNTYVVAPPSGSVSLQYGATFTTPLVNAILSGPGTYTADANGFHKTSQSTNPSAPPSGSGAGAADGGGAVDAGSAPAPASTCGGAGQAGCAGPNNDAVCNPGFTFDGNNLCTACGAQGEIGCRDANNNAVCNSGFTFDGNNLCTACGAQGEIGCRDANNNAVCNAGFTFDGNNLCTACGAQGEIGCRDANNNAVCNAGFTFDGNNLCTACGAQGEIGCRDANNNTTCNQGLSLNGSGLCGP